MTFLQFLFLNDIEQIELAIVTLTLIAFIGLIYFLLCFFAPFPSKMKIIWA